MNSDINKDYISDAFTKENDEVNLEADNFNVSCITSKDNKFNLDSDGNLTVKSINVLEGNTLDMQNIFNVVYPIGSIYMSVNEVSPKVLFGGEWEKISGRVLIGEGKITGDNTNPNLGQIKGYEKEWVFHRGETGGEFSHSLTIDEMPSHNHKNYNARWMQVGYQGNGYLWGYSADYQEEPQVLKNQGANQVHNNMPPYLAVSMWKRIA